MALPGARGVQSGIGTCCIRAALLFIVLQILEKRIFFFF